MLYTNFDLIELEKMDNEKLHIELEKAKDNYEYVQSLYEGENDTNPFVDKLPLQVIFTHLKNIENYIRRIENLINEYEIDRVFIQRAIKRRHNRLSKVGALDI